MSDQLPPYARLLGLTMERHGDEAVLVMPFGDDVLGRPGFLHGGAIAGLLEIAADMALRRRLDAEGGGRAEPVGVTLDYLRGGRDRPTRASAVVTRLSRRVCQVEATAWQDARDRPIAVARTTFLLSGRD